MAKSGSVSIQPPKYSRCPTDPHEHWLQLLDGFELHCSGKPVSLPMSAQRLVVFLALKNRPLLRVHVAATLWPDSPEVRSYASLRSTLWRLRCDGFQLVEATGTYLRLASRLVIDFHQITSRARRLLDGSAQRSNEELSPDWLSGDLLPDWYEDWVLTERERFRQLRLHARESMAQYLITDRRYGLAVEAALMAIRDEPLRESSHRLLVAAHLAQGNHSAAIAQYERFRQSLLDELGVRPSAHFGVLLREVLNAGPSGGRPLAERRPPAPPRGRHPDVRGPAGLRSTS
jgi:DNA-binding SARP family transcriptional activator